MNIDRINLPSWLRCRLGFHRMRNLGRCSYCIDCSYREFTTCFGNRVRCVFKYGCGECKVYELG